MAARLSTIRIRRFKLSKILGLLKISKNSLSSGTQDSLVCRRSPKLGYGLW